MVEALRRLDQAGGEMPAGVDLGLLAAAHRTYAARRRAGRMLRGAGTIAGAAALGIGAWAVWTGPRPGAGALVHGDVDGSGVVDILDALIVANGVRDGQASAAWDFDGDGAVTRADVEQVAIRAVRLGAGTVSR
ncbi:MAG: hypothetical protein IBJ10_11555 [Phycisphaerales bacterium]|nr:hypothetical protein [Phycisphaerales bacterium]